MEDKILNYISSLQWGQLKEFKNLAVIALFTKSSNGAGYITMEEALSAGLLRIKEISSGGSVPELIAENLAEMPVLLLDGEEVIGAKQNRILNTTILLEAKSKTIIPVSCVEAHRWHYTTESFAHSDVILNYDIRREKQRDVARSLNLKSGYKSDQGKVWQKIDSLAEDFNVKSQTGAINDIYVSIDERLKEYIAGFEYVEGQNGIFIFIDGRIAGFDILSKSDAFGKIFPKLIKSYAMDAARADIRDERIKNSSTPKTDKKPTASLEQAKYFVDEIKGCNENKFKSLGLGYDYRYEGQYAVGSALLCDDSVIHTAFFRIESQEDKTGNISSYKDRMRNRKN